MKNTNLFRCLFIYPIILFGTFQSLASISTKDLESVPMSRPWRRPEYARSTQARRISEKTFSANGNLENAYKFWLKVYTEFSSSYGVLHSTSSANKIYLILDFTDIDKRVALSEGFRNLLKQKRADQSREEYIKFHRDIDGDDIRFQLGQKDKMQKAIYTSGRYIEEMENIFKNEGLPIELTRLVFVESSFNILARSKVGASGLWQIMPGTAFPHNMIKNQFDLRNHPLKATQFAARLLKDNYRMLKNWPLAVTGYNHGPNGVKNLVSKYETNNLNEIITRANKDRNSPRSFGFASQNFYASFLAAIEAEKNAAKYFPGIRWAPKQRSKEIRLSKELPYRTLLSWFKGNSDLLERYNPHLSSRVKKEWARLSPNTPVNIPR